MGKQKIIKAWRENDKSRHNSVNDSGFGRDISKWVGKDSVLPTNVLSIPLVGKNMGHPAVFPVELPSFFIKLLSHETGLIIDPFSGSGSTGIAALMNNRNCLLIDNNNSYCKIAHERISKDFDNLYNKVAYHDLQKEYQSLVNELKEQYGTRKKKESKSRSLPDSEC